MQEVPEHEMIFSGFGVRVAIQFKRDGPFKGSAQLCRNITEIHYNYPLFPVGTLEIKRIFPFETETRTITISEKKTPSGKVAFESDVHQTGITYYFEELESFTVLKQETRPARPFCKAINRSQARHINLPPPKQRSRGGNNLA
jgi:hypothetical protein